MTTSVKQKLLFPLFSLVLGAMIAFLVGEVGARQFGLSKTWSSYIEGGVIMDYVSPAREIGFTRIPTASFVASSGVTFDINSLGFRESEIGPKGARVRIAFLGDSVTEGFGVDRGQRFSDYLETKLNRKADWWETLNFGVSGHATYDELHVLRSDVLAHAPDYAVLQFGSNDFKRNREIQLLKTGTPAFQTIETESGDGAFKTFLQKHSALYLAVAERYNLFKLRNNVLLPMWKELLQISAEEWSVTEARLVELAEECRENNIELIFLYVPLEVEVLIEDDGLGSAMGSRLADFCARQEIPYLDVVKAFRRHRNKTGIYLDDCHLTVLGNQIVGDVLYEHFAGPEPL